MRIVKKAVLVTLTLAALGLVAFWTFAPALVEKGKNVVEDHEPYPISDRAATLHETLVIGDWHADRLLKRGDYGQSHGRQHGAFFVGGTTELIV